MHAQSPSLPLPDAVLLANILSDLVLEDGIMVEGVACSGALTGPGKREGRFSVGEPEDNDKFVSFSHSYSLYIVGYIYIGEV